MEESNRQVMVLFFVSNTDSTTTATTILVVGALLIKDASHRETDQAPNPVSAMRRPETKTRAKTALWRLQDQNGCARPRQCRCNSLREGAR